MTARLPPPLLLRLTPSAFRLFATTAVTRTQEIVNITKPSVPKPTGSGRGGTGRKSSSVCLDAHNLKLNWLDSLSFPFPESVDSHGQASKSKLSDCCAAESGWVVGIDPDISGAVAVLNPDNSPQVFDSPHLQVLIGKRVRKRLDVKSIIQLLQFVNAPAGTTAYVEQSTPYPQDGKQGWWSGGFGYGLWIGILVASGFSVVPVPSNLWKNEFNLSGNRSSKDNSRELASSIFPSMGSLLKRKKDHGRAEALLIAAYGKGLKATFDSPPNLEDFDDSESR